ncbi:MAG: chromate efflux transporter [Candidatus Limnocylindria bacterium]
MSAEPAETAPIASERSSLLEILMVALRLGITSFGGPIAHIGYFRSEYVQRRRWVDESTFADLVALSQFLPGAASSKLGISIGVVRAGLPGGLVAWVGFTLPSAILMVIFALSLQNIGAQAAGWLHGLKVVAVAAVALAVWSMARNLAWDLPRGTIAIVAAAVILAFPPPAVLVAVVIVAAVIGWRFLPVPGVESRPHVAVPLPRAVWIASAVLYFVLLVALPVLRSLTDSQAVALFDAFYRAGALVFGGGNVVLPLLQPEVVPNAWVSNDVFLAGYAAAQAVPGPLFTFSAFLGAAVGPEPNGWAGALVALVAIFLPSFLLAFVALGTWGVLRSRPAVQATLRGVNAAVVGVLLAALYTPVITTSIFKPTDAALALLAFGLLAVWKVAPWVVVLFTAAGGALLTSLGG